MFALLSLFAKALFLAMDQALNVVDVPNVYDDCQQPREDDKRQIGKPVLLVDGEMMSWYGSRAVQGLRYLRKLSA